MGAPLKLDVTAWRDYLAQVYATRSDRRAALALVEVLEQQVAMMKRIRAHIGSHSSARALKAWNRDFALLAERVAQYRTEIPCVDVPDAACTFARTGWTGTPAAGANDYANTWVAKPILQGEWGDWYVGTPHPPRADAIEAAMLWNQLVAVHDLKAQMLADPELTSILFGARGAAISEWLIVAARELSRSAPGEEKTLLDALADGASNAADLLERWGARALRFVGYVALAGALVGGGVLAVKAARRRKERAEPVEVVVL